MHLVEDLLQLPYGPAPLLRHAPEVQVALLGDDQLPDQLQHHLLQALLAHAEHVIADSRQELDHLGVGAERRRPG